MSLRAAAEAVVESWDEEMLLGVPDSIEGLRSALSEPDEMAEARRLLNGAAALIEHELSQEWLYVAVEIRDFLKRLEGR